jgi:hypothetical protein
MKETDVVSITMLIVVAVTNLVTVAFMLGKWRSELASAIRRLEKLEGKVEKHLEVKNNVST